MCFGLNLGRVKKKAFQGLVLGAENSVYPSSAGTVMGHQICDILTPLLRFLLLLLYRHFYGLMPQHSTTSKALQSHTLRILQSHLQDLFWL